MAGNDDGDAIKLPLVDVLTAQNTTGFANCSFGGKPESGLRYQWRKPGSEGKTFGSVSSTDTVNVRCSPAHARALGCSRVARLVRWLSVGVVRQVIASNKALQNVAETQSKTKKEIEALKLQTKEIRKLLATQQNRITFP